MTDRVTRVLCQLIFLTPWGKITPHCINYLHLCVWTSLLTWNVTIHLEKTKLSRLMTKPTKLALCHPVWSASSLPAWWNLGSLAIHWAHSEDSDQTGWMPESSLGKQSFCWFCHEAAYLVFIKRSWKMQEHTNSGNKLRGEATWEKQSPYRHKFLPNFNWGRTTSKQQNDNSSCIDKATPLRRLDLDNCSFRVTSQKNLGRVHVDLCNNVFII